MLHATLPSVSAHANGGVVPARQRFTPNPALGLAQLVLVVQGLLGLATGINLIRGTTGLPTIAAGVNLSVSASLAKNYGIGIVVIGGLLILGALTVSIPSQIVRSLLAILETVGLGVTLAAHFGGASVLGFVTVLTLGATGTAIIPFGAVVGIQSAVIYLLAIHPPTYRAFAAKRTWVSYATR